jgi:hypothetical protein
MSDNPTSPVERLRKASRCHAKAKRAGQTCRCAAVKGWRVCRVHGARGGAPRGPKHGNYRHGERTREALETKRAMGALLRDVRDLCDLINGDGK